MREFFENLNAKLVEVIRKNKQDHETKTLEMENKMLQEKIKYKAEIDTVCQERDRRSKELNNAKQILMDLGFGVVRKIFYIKKLVYSRFNTCRTVNLG